MGRLKYILGLSLIWGLGVCGCGSNGNGEQQNSWGDMIGRLWRDKSAQRREEMIENLRSEDGDKRREGVLMLGEGEASDMMVTGDLLASLARNDAEGQVRAVAIKVLAEVGPEEKLQEVLGQAAADESDEVRRTVVEVLSGREGEQYMVILAGMLQNEADGDIRTRAAAGLGNYRSRAAVESLIRALKEDMEFGVWYRARESLKRLTGEDFGYDGQAWEEWLAGTDAPIVDKLKV